MSNGESPLVVLTPPGWAAVASERLAQAFPSLRVHTPQIQSLLLPLFRKAVDGALERAYQGLITEMENPPHEDPSPRS